MDLKFSAVILALLLPQSSLADVVLAARTLRARTILTASDVILRQNDTVAGLSKISQVIGFETRVTLYEGRPISLSDIGPAAIIERNQIVMLVYASGPLVISADGRALGRAAAGEGIKVMNLASRKIVYGVVDSRGVVVVGAGANIKY